MCSFLKKDEEAIDKIFESASVETDLLLRCSKLLEYDFFRIYSSHLILYAPPSAVDKVKNPNRIRFLISKKYLYSGDQRIYNRKDTIREMTHNEIIQDILFLKVRFTDGCKKFKKTSYASKLHEDLSGYA
jgi:hypothetical protein